MLPDTERKFREPWQFRKRLVPARTYSGRVVYDRPFHPMQAGDLARMARALAPPEPGEPEIVQLIIRALRAVSLEMLDKILPFLDNNSRSEIYDAGIRLIDGALGTAPDRNVEGMAIINQIATELNIPIEFL